MLAQAAKKKRNTTETNRILMIWAVLRHSWIAIQKDLETNSYPLKTIYKISKSRVEKNEHGTYLISRFLQKRTNQSWQRKGFENHRKSSWKKNQTKPNKKGSALNQLIPVPLLWISTFKIKTNALLINFSLILNIEFS